MVSSEWILNNLQDYLSKNDVNINYGWFQIKVDGIIKATNVDFREKVVDELIPNS